MADIDVPMQRGSDLTGAPDDAATDVRTFLIADVRGYTLFTQKRGDEAAAALATEFVRLCRHAVAARRGQVLEIRGDEVLAVFRSPRAALRAAIDLQQSSGKVERENLDFPLRIGVGIDAGEAVPFEGGFRGRALNLASRLCSAARPGEVLVSETIMTLAGRVPGVAYGIMRTQRLKGFDEPVPFAPVWSEEYESDTGPENTPPGVTSRTSSDPVSQLPIGGFLGARPESPLVTRNGSVPRLTAMLDAVRAGNGQTIVITGEAGIGKTRVAQEIACAALQGGFLVAVTTCYEQRQTSPLFGFRDVLRVLVEEHSGWTELRDRWPLLARLYADEGDLLGSNESRDGKQDQLFEAATDFVLAVAESQPVALMMDDLQWADASTLELLVYLSRRTRTRSVLLVGTFRESELDAGQPLAEAVYELERQRLSERIVVQKLNREETAALVASVLESNVVSESVVSLLYESTEGNPFYIREMLSALIENGDVRREGNQWVAPRIRSVLVPDRVRALVDRRLRGLTADDRTLLCEASVLGSVFSFSYLKAISRRSEEDIESTLESALASGVLREQDADHFAFAHPLIRQTLYNSVSGRRRRRLHLAAGEALAQARTGGAPAESRPTPSEVSWHFLQAEDAERALPYALEAARDAQTVGAYAEAERQYRIVLDLNASHADDADTAFVLEQLATVLKTLGRYGESLELAERSVQIYESVADLEGQRRSVSLVSLLELLLDRPSDGLARLAPMLDLSGDEAPTSGLARVFGTQAQLLLASARYQAGSMAAERAAQIARACGDTRTEIESEVYRGEALGILGNYDDARRILESAAERANDADLTTVARALNGVGTALFYAGKFELCKTYHSRAVELARRSGDPRALAGALNALASSQVSIGEWKAAHESAAEALQIAERADISARLQESRLAISYVSLLEGNPIESLEVPVVGKPLSAHEQLIADMWVGSLAARYVLEGRCDLALAELRNVNSGSAAVGWQAGFRALTEASAHVGLGNYSEAEALVEKAASDAMRSHNRPTLAEALLTRGTLRLAQHRLEEAERLLQAARTLARDMPYPYVEAGALVQIFILRRRQGTYQEARAALEQALQIFRRLGARLDMRRALSALTDSVAR